MFFSSHVVGGLTLAPLIALVLLPRLGFEASILVAIGVSVLVHFSASVVGRVWAETLLDGLWPIAQGIRIAATPLTTAAELVEALAARIAGPIDAPPRPASVEVEFQADPDDPEDLESELPESTRQILEHVVALTRTDVSEVMTPGSSMIVLSATTSAHHAAKVFRETGLSRIPVFGENRDDILGILYAKDLFPAMTDTQDFDSIQPGS